MPDQIVLPEVVDRERNVAYIIVHTKTFYEQ